MTASFDAWWSEHGPQAFPIEVHGETFHVPAEMPALTRLFTIAMSAKDEDDTVDEDQAMEALAAVVGWERVNAWRAAGDSADKLSTLLGWIVGQYLLHRKADPEGEAPAPETGATPEATSSTSGN